MKHSIPMKFIAILLCAASLLAAAAGGLGILYLAETGLYTKNADDLLREEMEGSASALAQQLAQNYASTALGGCPEEMLGHYHFLNAGYYGYTIADETGAVLYEEALLSPDSTVYSYTFPVSGSYMKVIDSREVLPPATQSPVEEWVYEAIGDGKNVYSITVTVDGVHQSFGSSEPMGWMYHMDEGFASFDAYTPGCLDMDMEPGEEVHVTQITFLDEFDAPIFDASGENLGLLWCDSEGIIHFSSPEPVDPNTEPTLSVTEPVVADGKIFRYYDEELGQELELEYVWEVMPSYTVTITATREALPGHSSYTFGTLLRAYRYDLPWLLGIGLLLFAITLVYLCCAAGRHPGSDERRPSGLNRLPLDLYLAAAGFGVVVLAFAFVEGGEALVREDPHVGIGFMAGAGYGMALLIVAFFYAFAAQVKAPDKYWLRNTVCGRFLMLVVKFIRWCDRGAHKVWPAFCAGMKIFWGKFKRAVVKTVLFFERFLTALCALTIRGVKAGWKLLGRFFRWCFRCLKRFFSLLPLTWQWIVTGFVLMFLMFCAIRAHSAGTMLLCFCAAFAILIYGSHCFGVLLESAKKMRRGDLESKVDDKLLLGCFRDFSDELNGLAGVATVAVQQQLKSERMKAELVTNVSHDIKTPLTSIINYVDLMKLPHSDEEHELYLEVLDRQSQRLKKLIEDLMEMSKASTGNMAVELAPVQAAEAITQALGEFSDKFHAANLEPVFHSPEEPVTMLADGRLIWRILSNLLNNACKYALPGTRVYLDLLTLDGKAVITLKNISREQLNVAADELMERFVRGDASRNTEGSGLGLNIARSLAQLQGGQMELTVDGDLFKVTLLFPLV